MIESIEIENYRSIEICKINTVEISGRSCVILLGKNEAGKSSILKAISLLNPLTPFSYVSDCNKSAKKRKANIVITFTLNIIALGKVAKMFKEIEFPKPILNQLQIRKFQHRVNIYPDESDYRNFWIYINDIDVLGEYVYNTVEEKFYSLVSLGIKPDVLTKDNIENELGTAYKIVHNSLIESILEDRFKKDYFELLPDCIYWENRNDYLINDPIDLEQFSRENSISKPLLNIFRIAEISDIEERILLIKDDYEERSQLKDELSKSITKHINGIWPEHKINIRVEIEGMMCRVMVEDQEDDIPKYKMEQRSDGFKQFISILLNLSTKDLSQKIILMDEPEVHLHPSGAKFLRDEILRISETNIVIISTHSIYMVDKLNLERHIKVFKEKSVTSLKKLNKNNPYEEEVIYEALGTSIYEHISPNMVLFEGKTDKDLFDSFSLKFKVDYKPLSIGSISTDGVTKIPQYIKFIDGKFVRGYVVLDSDPDGQKIKKELLKDDNSVTKSNIFEINDIMDIRVNATLEDLYPMEVIFHVLQQKYDLSTTLDNRAIVKQLDDKNKQMGGKINLKDIKGFFVDYILSDLKVLTKEKAIEKYTLLYQFYHELHRLIKLDRKSEAN